MPKMKTNSRAKKTFKATGTGKLTHRRANNGHFRRKKSSGRKRRLAQAGSVAPADSVNVRKMVPHL